VTGNQSTVRHLLDTSQTSSALTYPMRPYALLYFGSSSRAFLQSFIDFWCSLILPYAAALDHTHRPGH